MAQMQTFCEKKCVESLRKYSRKQAKIMSGISLIILSNNYASSGSINQTCTATEKIIHLLF